MISAVLIVFAIAYWRGQIPRQAITSVDGEYTASIIVSDSRLIAFGKGRSPIAAVEDLERSLTHFVKFYQPNVEIYLPIITSLVVGADISVTVFELDGWLASINSHGNTVANARGSSPQEAVRACFDVYLENINPCMIALVRENLKTFLQNFFDALFG